MHEKNAFEGDQLLAPYLARIARAIDALDPELSATRASRVREARELRLEPWEISAFRKLTDRRPLQAKDHADVFALYVSAAALRLRIAEEAIELSSASDVSEETLQSVSVTLARARELDSTFSEYLSEGVFRADSPELDQLFRSRFRLLRGFSGLWLLYDELRRKR